MVIVCFGLPGSGKTFLSERLSKKLDIVHLSTDRIRKELFDDPMYSKEEKERVYSELFQRLTGLLQKGRSVVLDATFSSKDQRELLKLMMDKHSITPLYIELFASYEVTRERTEKKRDWSDADYEVFLMLKELYPVMEEDHLKFDSGLWSVEEIMGEIINKIQDSDE